MSFGCGVILKSLKKICEEVLKNNCEKFVKKICVKVELKK
jgi:hypothetical protein